MFTLYGTSACHLCELAYEMLTTQQRSTAGFAFTEIDISESDVLFERYGIRIPVLQHPDQRELDWPFSAQQLQAFIAS